jgi:hypothetical protein
MAAGKSVGAEAEMKKKAENRKQKTETAYLTLDWTREFRDVPQTHRKALRSR